MAQSDRITGKNAKILFVDDSGTVDISADYRVLNVNRSIKTVDLTAGADDATFMKGTTKDYKADMEVLDKGTQGTTDWYRVREGVEGTLLWGEEGTAAGKPKGGLPVLVEKVDQGLGYEKEVTRKITFAPQGGLVFDPLTDTW